MPEPALRISLLGVLRVVRADGTIVEPGAWRTGKTADLLRLLALDSTHSAHTMSLIRLLWPDVDDVRGRASLRTAASQIRRAVDHDCLVREPGGLRLVSAAVDVDEFRRLVDGVRVAVEAGAHDDVVRLGQAAEAAYRGDFHAHDDDAGWATTARSTLRWQRVTALTEASVAALELSRFRTAIDLARTIVAAEPTSERAHRVLMRAHAALGETAEAIRVFEAHRQRLADELGIFPSRRTRELHAELLRDPCP